MAYFLIKGSIPDGLEVQHACNNRICCNPNHLELGDHFKNIQYMVKCGRQTRREDRWSAKLSEDDVREIHKLYKEQRRIHPGYRQWQITEPIAKKYGITTEHVNRILRGKSWQNVYDVILVD